MVFSSFEFLFRFLPFFLLIYYVTPQKWKNAVLFAGSILFYTAGEAEYVVLLLASVVINYVFGRLMYRDTYEGRGKKQLILLIVALCYDFGVLFLFKYSGFMDKLPLGISFYTFQIAAYIIDVYRGRVPVEKSFIRLGTYVTMFPQLIAGPIINYSEVRMALCSRTVTFEQFESGLKTLILGLGAKVIVADRIGLLWNNIQAIGFESISTPLAWMGAFAYSIELYFDFSGYWDWDGCLDLNFRKTLNIPIFQDRYPNSGEDGILRLDAGSGNMSIFRLAATGSEKHVRYLIYLWYGV